MHNHLIKDLNCTVNNADTLSAGYTSTPTLNNRDNYYYNHVITMMAYNEISQLALPMNQTKRIAYRGSGDLNSTTPITTSWREIPYVDETPLLQDNGNNTKKIVVDRLEGTADSSKCTAPIINIGSYRNKTVKELRDKLKEIIGTSNNGHSFIVEANNVDRDFLANNWFNDAAILNGGADYVTFHISCISGGRTALITFRTPSSKYEVFLDSGNWTRVDKWATQDFVQKAIEEAFKKRNL